jgi:hypothetical protein
MYSNSSNILLLIYFVCIVDAIVDATEKKNALDLDVGLFLCHDNFASIQSKTPLQFVNAHKDNVRLHVSLVDVALHSSTVFKLLIFADVEKGDDATPPRYSSPTYQLEIPNLTIEVVSVGGSQRSLRLMKRVQQFRTPFSTHVLAHHVDIGSFFNVPCNKDYCHLFNLHLTTSKDPNWLLSVCKNDQKKNPPRPTFLKIRLLGSDLQKNIAKNCNSNINMCSRLTYQSYRSRKRNTTLVKLSNFFYLFATIFFFLTTVFNRKFVFVVGIFLLKIICVIILLFKTLVILHCTRGMARWRAC